MNTIAKESSEVWFTIVTSGNYYIFWSIHNPMDLNWTEYDWPKLIEEYATMLQKIKQAMHIYAKLRKKKEDLVNQVATVHKSSLLPLMERMERWDEFTKQYYTVLEREAKLLPIFEKGLQVARKTEDRFQRAAFHSSGRHKEIAETLAYGDDPAYGLFANLEDILRSANDFHGRQTALLREIMELQEIKDALLKEKDIKDPEVTDLLERIVRIQKIVVSNQEYMNVELAQKLKPIRPTLNRITDTFLEASDDIRTINSRFKTALLGWAILLINAGLVACSGISKIDPEIKDIPERLHEFVAQTSAWPVDDWHFFVMYVATIVSNIALATYLIRIKKDDSVVSITIKEIEENYAKMQKRLSRLTGSTS